MDTATSPEASATYGGSGEKTIVETSPMEEAAALEKLSDEPEYPTGLKLAVIMMALCLSVFLVALVSPLSWATPPISRSFSCSE